jgi:dihydroxyacetone kinase-like predicted kinase
MRFLHQVELAHGTGDFGYCTNFLVTGSPIRLDAFRAEMSRLGTSAIVVGDENAAKVHIHSEHPGAVLEAVLSYGELHEVRVDNMGAQTKRLLSERAAEASTVVRSDTGIGIVTVANGSGLAEVLSGLGATEIVHGGPTLNPSTEDLVRAVDSVQESQVIILPNDPNIIPIALQVDQLSRKTVRVVPSRSIPQAITALSAFNLDADLERNVETMTAALEWVRSLAVCRATRDATIGTLRVRAGQFLGLVDGEPRATAEDALEAALAVLKLAEPEQAELVTLFVGEPAESGLSDRLAAAISEICPDLTVEISPGGQSHFDLIISLE